MSPPEGRAGAAPDVSVVVAAHDVEAHLERAVTSALAQEGVRVEVVVVDDASRDRTAVVARRLDDADSRVTAISNATNLGPGGTRDVAIAAATGRWVAVLDADDAMWPGRLARLVEVSERERLDVIADVPVLHDLTAGRDAPKQLPADGHLQRLAVDDLLPSPERDQLDLGLLKPVFRRSLATDGRWRYPNGVRHGEDFELYLRLVAQGVDFGLLHEHGYVYSTRIGAVSGSWSPGTSTTVDYLGIARRCDRLAERQDNTPAVVRVLRAKARQARRGNRVYGWTLVRRRELTHARRWLRQDAENVREVGRVVLAKLRGHRGVPDWDGPRWSRGA